MILRLTMEDEGNEIIEEETFFSAGNSTIKFDTFAKWLLSKLMELTSDDLRVEQNCCRFTAFAFEGEIFFQTWKLFRSGNPQKFLRTKCRRNIFLMPFPKDIGSENFICQRGRQEDGTSNNIFVKAINQCQRASGIRKVYLLEIL